MSNKSTDDVAAACFVEWICKLSVPQVIDTNLSEDQAEALKDELDITRNQDIPHNLFIDANSGSCFKRQLMASTKWSMRLSSVGKIFFQPSTLPTTRRINHPLPS